MGLKVQNTQGEYETPAAGVYSSVLVEYEDKGIEKREYKGTTKFQPRVRLLFLLDEPMSDGRPFLVSHWLTVTTDDRGNMSKFLRAWGVTGDLEGFDLETLIGKPGLVTVAVGDSGYANIVGISPLMRGQQPFDASGYERRFDNNGLPLDEGKRAAWYEQQERVRRERDATQKAPSVGSSPSAEVPF